jgi:hypothetical protein
VALTRSVSAAIRYRFDERFGAIRDLTDPHQCRNGTQEPALGGARAVLVIGTVPGAPGPFVAGVAQLHFLHT